MSNHCPFCTLAADRVVMHNDVGLVVRDAFPVSVGHTLIIPKRHIASIFDATEEEAAGLVSLLQRAKEELQQRYRPTAFNIGINDGVAAGQTVPHSHVHLIPRYQGDSRDPRGGVRWVLPERADYWTGA